MSDADYLLSAAAVRERCGIVYEAAADGQTQHFRLVPERLADAAERVSAITRRHYPDLAVPFHSRWRHFTEGGVDREALIAPDTDLAERTRAKLDLAIVSVLLDAGVGSAWRYRETATGLEVTRSEGIAVASLRALETGLFSSQPLQPWRADAGALAVLSAERLGDAFQHGPGNVVGGLEARAGLLRRLGEVVAVRSDVFGEPARLGNLYDFWLPRREGLPAPEMLRLILRALGPIWPGRLSLGGMPLGDCARHSAVPGTALCRFTS